MTPELSAALAAIRSRASDAAVAICYPSVRSDGGAPFIMARLSLDGIELSLDDILRIPRAERESAHGCVVSMLEAFRRRRTEPSPDELRSVATTVGVWWCFELIAGRAEESLVPTAPAAPREASGAV